PEEGRAVATDGHRLVKLQLDNLTADREVEFIVPEKAMSLAGKVVSDEHCSISVDEGYVSFDFANSRVLARLIDEAYPNYEAVIPIENEKRMVVDRDAMLAAVRRVGLYSSSMTNQIRLAIDRESVE